MQKIYVDAKDPSRSYSSNQARVFIRSMIGGFQAAGLKKGDCVCLHSFNDVSNTDTCFRSFSLIDPLDSLSIDIFEYHRYV